MVHQEQDRIDSSLILPSTHTRTSRPSKQLQGNDYPTLVSSLSKKKDDTSLSSANQHTAGEVICKQVTEIIIKRLGLTWRQLIRTKESKKISENQMVKHVILMEHWKMPQRWNGQTHQVPQLRSCHGCQLLNTILMSWVMRKITTCLPSFQGYVLLFMN